MRILAALAVLVATAPLSAEATLSPPPTPPFAVHLDVPQDKGAQQVNVLIREFPVGGTSGWHVHSGVEIAYLLSGEMTLEQAGQPVRRLLPGESFTMPRGTAHNGVNVGRKPARLMITYVVDKDAPLRTPVDAPRAH